MRRADRQDSNYDNENKYPRSRQEEPTSPHELKQLLGNARAQRDEWQQRAKENQEAATQLVHVQQEAAENLTERDQLKQKNQETATQLVHVQHEFQRTLTLYNEERTRATELLAKYNEVDAERSKYLSLYNEVQSELKFERKSKAGIKGWETRRKRENQLLKQEIAEMTLLVRESLVRKDEAVDNLYTLADRMDRIQRLVDSVEEGTSSTPVGLLQKLKRVWLAVKEILGE
jgi:chromosome segregation ATPase